jgi:hypothetical protein
MDFLVTFKDYISNKCDKNARQLLLLLTNLLLLLANGNVALLLLTNGNVPLLLDAGSLLLRCDNEDPVSRQIRADVLGLCTFREAVPT